MLFFWPLSWTKKTVQEKNRIKITKRKNLRLLYPSLASQIPPLTMDVFHRSSAPRTSHHTSAVFPKHPTPITYEENKTHQLAIPGPWYFQLVFHPSG